MNIRPLPWRALLLAPFASVPALTIAGLGSSDAGFVSDFGLGIFFGILVGVPFSLAALVIIGLPLYFLLRRFGLFKLWTVAAAGIVVPLAMFHDVPYRAAIAVAAAGLAVSLSAYFLARQA